MIVMKTLISRCFVFLMLIMPPAAFPAGSAEEAVDHLSARYYRQRSRAVQTLGALSVEEQLRVLPAVLEAVASEDWRSTKFGLRALVAMEGVHGEASVREAARNQILTGVDKRSPQRISAAQELWMKTLDPERRDVAEKFMLLLRGVVNSDDWEQVPQLRPLIGAERRAIRDGLLAVLPNMTLMGQKLTLITLGAMSDDQADLVRMMFALAERNPDLAGPAQEALERLKESNVPPVLTIEQGVRELVAGRDARFRVTVSDADDFPASLRLETNRPREGEFHQVGALEWVFRSKPGKGGEAALRFTAKDGSGGSTDVEWKLTLVPDTQAPKVVEALRYAMIDPGLVTLRFDEPVNEKSLTAKSVQVDRGRVTDVRLKADRKTAVVRLDGVEGEGPVMLALSGLADLAKPVNRADVKTRVEAARPTPGLRLTYFEGRTNDLRNMEEKLEPLYLGKATAFGEDIQRNHNDYGFMLEGWFLAREAGKYRFSTTSDNHSMLRIGDRDVVNNSKWHPVRKAEGTLTLEAGWHPIRIERWNKADSEKQFAVHWQGPGMEQPHLLDTAPLAH